MMKKFNYITLCASIIGVSLISMTTRADPVNLNVIGNVVASPCTVDTNTVLKVVNLGQITKQNLLAAGSGGDWTDFDLLVTNCPAGTATVIATFTGTTDTQDTTAWKNTGSSTNVALRIASRDHNTVYSANGTMQVSVNNSNHNADFPLSARIITPQGNATAGTFQSVMSVNFTYQ